MYPRTLLNWLVPPLRPLEERLLAAVEANLAPSLADQLRAQRQKINYVQRRIGGREVGLYTIVGGRPVSDRSLQLPVGGREWRLARAILRKDEAKWTAAVHLVDGHLSSIEYDLPPPRNAEDVTIEKIEVFDTPAQPSHPRDSSRTLPGWLRAYADRYGISSVDRPLAQEDRTVLLEQMETQFPLDYVDLIARCNGVRLGPVSLVGLTDAYETRTEDGEYVVLGQVNGNGALAVRKPGPAIVFFNYEDGSVTEMGSSLQEALNRVIPL